MPLAASSFERPDPPRLTPLGLDGMLVTFGDAMDDAANRAALAFRAAIDAENWQGVTETASSLCSAFVSFEPGQLSPSDLQARLREILADRDWLAEDLPANRTLWTIPASFEGDHAPQLADAAELAGVSVEQAVKQICAEPLRAYALGYAPGQAYLGALPEHWDLARQKDLTPTVKEGAVVTAVRQVIVFATSGPTGWRQIGMSRFKAFRPDDPDRPIALAPGDEVQLRPVSRDELDRLAAEPLAGATAEDIR
ncbi:carboxyltransferase domain-containing protein [Maribius pontilimi]|uniref:Carboxyltransferase domain-containing protein n=1 Tax=Palleronia pontilimi TaxID=1964209 RepID=A0A934IG74_9RHOB|nr:carboxyltransferase domain-containing protein [Palleronia pontilimi]MBJ3762313.1 carboxyltransferase domain-containing protein [Palleronia pontilimi]